MDSVRVTVTCPVCGDESGWDFREDYRGNLNVFVADGRHDSSFTCEHWTEVHELARLTYDRIKERK
jgi:hypothetical protein